MQPLWFSDACEPDSCSKNRPTKSLYQPGAEHMNGNANESPPRAPAICLSSLTIQPSTPTTHGGSNEASPRVTHSGQNLTSSSISSLAELLATIPEITENILGRVDVADLRTCLCVNHAIGAIAAKLLWSELSFHNFHGYLGLKEILKILKNPNRTLPYERFVNTFALTYEANPLGARRDVQLDNLFLDITSLCVNMQSVSIDIGSTDKLKWSTVIDGLKVMGNLTAVQLVARKDTRGAVSSQSVVNDRTLIALAGRQASRLRWLRIAGDDFSDQGVLEVAKHCRQLRHFAALYCPGVSTTSLLHLTRSCPHLESLSLHQCGLNPLSFARIVGTQGCEGTLRVMHLDLSQYSQCEGLQNIVRNCPKLQELSLSNAADNQLQVLAPALTRLDGLRLQRPAFSDAAAEAFALHLGNLTTLWISHTPLLTDKQLAIMRPCLLKIKSFTLENVPGVTDAGIRTAAEALKSLQWITLDSPQLTIMALVALCTTCSTVEQAWFKGISLTREVFWQCLPMWPKLNWAKIETISFSTRDEYMAFAQVHPNVAKALSRAEFREGYVPFKMGTDFEWKWDDHTLPDI